MYLAIANLLHHKVRSLLSALAVGIGVAMLVTLLGLTHGSLNEVTRRGRAIDADFLVIPKDWSSVMIGAPFSDRHIPLAMAAEVNGKQVVSRIAPIFRDWTTISPADGQDAKDLQTVFGIHPADWDFFAGGPMVAGKMFEEPADLDSRLADLRSRNIDGGPAGSQPDEAARQTLAAAFQVVIDERLAREGHIGVGDQVRAWGRRFTVAGIAREGVTVRVFVPLTTLRFIHEKPRGATFLMVKIHPGIDTAAAKAAISAKVGGRTVTVEEYSNLLTEAWKIIPQYTQITSIVVLVVAFLFVLVIMYTVVIQRTREIGILKSLGAGGGYIVRTVLAESMMLSLAGTTMGLAISFGAKAAILRFKPLLTVDLNWTFLLAGVATGLIGGVLSGIYPALVAARQDPVTALSYE